MSNIKLIFHYQVRQERVIFFSSRKEENKWKMGAKVSLCLTSFFKNKNRTICGKLKDNEKGNKNIS